MSVVREMQYGVCHNEMEPDGERRHIRSAPRGERPTAEPHILHRSQTDCHVSPSVAYCDDKHTHLHLLPFISH